MCVCVCVCVCVCINILFSEMLLAIGQVTIGYMYINLSDKYPHARTFTVTNTDTVLNLINYKNKVTNLEC